MPNAIPNNQPPLTKFDLIGYFAAGSKPRRDWKIGVEMERFAFNCQNLKPLTYNGEPGNGAPGVLSLLEYLIEKNNWQPVFENGSTIALQRGNSAITLEPGGQIELSAPPLKNLRDCADAIQDFLTETRIAGDDLNIGFLALGFDPKWDRADFDFMPKKRYDIMRAYMPAVGSMGIDMMQRTATVQVNLDYESESDMAQKLRVALCLQPVVAAMFANSPFTGGKPNGFQSYRNHVWQHTDPARSGDLPFAFENGMGFERYADYVLDVPMYFAIRGEKYIPAAGQSFRDFMNGKLPALPGVFATIDDWENHVSCVFPTVRLKKWLEMRGADSGNAAHSMAIAALWTGLLYDDGAQNAAYDIVKKWNGEDRMKLYAETPQKGLRASVQNRPLIEISKDIAAIAHAGLKARGLGEEKYLHKANEILNWGKSPADDILEKFQGVWGGNIDPLFQDSAE